MLLYCCVYIYMSLKEKFIPKELKAIHLFQVVCNRHFDASVGLKLFK